MKLKRILPILLMSFSLSASGIVPSVVFANTISNTAENADITNAIIEETDNDEITADKVTVEYDNGIEVTTEVDTGKTAIRGGHISLPVDNEPVGSIYDNLPEDEIPNVFAAEIPASYKPSSNSEMLDYLPDTRNQNPTGSCWAHAAMAMAEINLAKSEKIAGNSADYSELELAYFAYNAPIDPLGGLEGDKNIPSYKPEKPNCYQLGGNISVSETVLSAWKGAADEIKHNTGINIEGIDYKSGSHENPNGVIKESFAFDDEAHLIGAYHADIANHPDEVKQLILTYGAVGISYWDDDAYHCDGDNDALEANATYYMPIPKAFGNHEVVIVGWDDDFSKSNFNQDVKPSRNGAWLIRNSWSADAGIKYSKYNYFWMSYESMGIDSNVASYEFDLVKDSYDYNYQYDGGSANYTYKNMVSGTKAANVFTASSGEEHEYLRAVGLTTGIPNQRVKVEIYKNVTGDTNPINGTCVDSATTETTLTYSGFHTIQLRDVVTIDKNTKFSVVITFLSENNTLVLEGTVDNDWYNAVAKSRKGESFYKNGSKEINPWNDLSTLNGAYGNFRIKAYVDGNNDETHQVTEVKVEPKEMTVGVGLKKNVGYTVLPLKATNRSVSFESSNEGVARVENGYVIGVSKGTATITVKSDENGSIKDTCTVTVTDKLQTITLNPEKAESFRYCDEVFKLIATLEPYNEEYKKGLVWTSDNDSIASVDSEGTVTLNNVGTATITARSGEVSGSIQIIVYPPVPEFIQNSSSLDGQYAVLRWINDERVDEYEVIRYKIVGDVADEATKKVFEHITYSTNGSNGVIEFKDEFPTKTDKYQYKVIVKKTVEDTLYSVTYSQTLQSEIGYRISYEVNGGVLADNTKYVLFPSRLTELYAPSRFGYDFGGWYFDANFNNRVNITVKETGEQCLVYNSVSGDTKVYAKWIPKQYKIQYFSNNNDSLGYEETVSYGEKIVIKENMFDYPGYVLREWNEDGNNASPLLSHHPGDEIEGNIWDSLFGSEVINLFAYWDEDELKTITCYLYEGTMEDEPGSYWHSAGGAIDEPTKDGFDFDGWYFEENYSQESKLEKNNGKWIIQPYSGDVSIYAKWVEHVDDTDNDPDEGNTNNKPNGEDTDNNPDDGKTDGENTDDKKDDGKPDDKKDDGTVDDGKDDNTIVDKNDPSKYDISKDVVIPKDAVENKTDEFVFHGLKDEYQYTGDAILPTFDVWFKTDTGRKLLVNGIDYVVKVTNNKNAGKGIISIIGKGNYAGTVNQTAEFTIKDNALEQPKGNISIKGLYKIDGISKTGYLYNGYEIKPSIRVIAKKETLDTKQVLEEGKDYIVSWSNNVAAGKATVLISGIGEYCGSIKLKFNISKLNMTENSSDYTVTLSDDVKKNGIPLNNAKGVIPKVSVVYNPTNTKLVLDKDYTIKCTNNRTVTNDAKFVITGRGNYSGKLDSKTGYFSGDRSFNVVKGDISEIPNSVSSNFIICVPNLSAGAKVLSTKYEVYDKFGNKLKTKIVGSEAESYTVKNGVAAVVTYDGKILNPAVKEDKAIIAVPGKKITFTLYGTGNYTGIRHVDTSVVAGDATAKAISKVIVNKAYSYSSTGKPVTLDENSITVVTKNGGQVDKDSFDVIYSNNINKGTAIAVFVGKGEYAGYKVVKFKIGPCKF